MNEYIVTARKWRPMRFDDVIGQAHVITTLRNAIASQRIAHAYLFSGPRGVGKTTTARLLAKAVNCLAPLDQNPDNSCDLCREITEGRSFDVLEIDGASNRGVEEIRNLRESTRYAPAKAHFKVYIIDEVHMLTKEAFNALLKTLEEPPPQVLFIFATTEINKVPPTILSRCQRFDFRRIRTEDIAANLRTIALAEGFSVDQDAVMIVARKADGSLRDAQSLFDQVVALCGPVVTSTEISKALKIVDKEVYFRVTELIKGGDAKGGLALVDELINAGDDLKEFLSGLIEHFRNLLIARTTGATALIETSELYRQRYAAEAVAFSVADILRLQRLVAGTESALRWTSQPRFKLEADIVQMIIMPRAIDIGELLQQIDELKKKDAEVSHIPKTGKYWPLAPQTAPSSGFPAIELMPASPVVEISLHWQEFLGEVRQKKISLLSALENAKLLSVEHGRVRLACADEFQASMVSNNKEVLAELFHRVFNFRPVLITEVVDGNEGKRDAMSERELAGKKTVPEHPVVTAMKRELGAEPL